MFVLQVQTRGIVLLFAIESGEGFDSGSEQRPPKHNGAHSDGDAWCIRIEVANVRLSIVEW